MRGFYFITDAFLSQKGNAADVKVAACAGVAAIQYRAKNLEFSQMVKEALTLKPLCRNVPFIINDSLAVALAVHSDGVHLGQKDGSVHEARQVLGIHAIIGVSVTTLTQAMDAEAHGADYLGIGPIFGTTTKDDADAPCGTKLIVSIKKKCRIPLVAIGGINLDNAQQVIEAGADAICAISATVTQGHVQAAIGQFQNFFQRNKNHGS